jgi:hypothetical protein
MAGHDVEAKLYGSVREFFVEEDGSLPEVQIEGIEPAEAQAILEVLRPLGEPSRSDQTAWYEERHHERPIGDFENPGRLAAEGRLCGAALCAHPACGGAEAPSPISE